MGVEVRKECVLLADGSTMTHEQLRARVTLVEDAIVKFREPAFGSAESLAVLGDYIRETRSRFRRFVLMADLAEAGHPPPGYRERIVEWMREQKCVHMCFVQPGGIVQRVALRFMVSRAGISMSIHASNEEALERARLELH